MRSADVVIIGGGVIGCSIAYHLMRRAPSQRVVVLEREAMLGMGSTAKATGAIRYQFSTTENIRLTQLSLPIYRRFEEETGYSVNFRPHGRLIVTGDARTMDELRAGVALQQALGVPSRTVTAPEAQALVPELRTDDLLGGTFCQEDGSAEPSAAVQGFSARARVLGAEIRCEQEVVGLRRTGARVSGVETHDGGLDAGTVVIAAGPSSASVARWAGLDVPALPFRRQVSVVAPIPALDVEMPLVTDADTGFYIHRTGHGDLLLGGTDRDTRPGEGSDVEWDGVERVLSAGARRIPRLVEARVRRSYSGVRALTPDYHPIVGRVSGLDGLVLACGDNGKGFMHAPAIGLLVSELIVDGRAASLDLGAFRLERFAAPVRKEANFF